MALPFEPTAKPITENEIYKDLETATRFVREVYLKTRHFVIVTGPAGLGKTTLVRRVCEEFGRRWNPVSPRSIAGFLELLYENRFEGVVLVCDDFDELFFDRQYLNIMKSALDTQRDRWIRHDVTGKKKIRPFPVKCAMIFLSNINFSKPDQFPGKLYDTHVLPVLQRGALINLSFDDRAIYEYTGHVATEGGMLRPLARVQQNPGERKTVRHITLAESNEVLQLFHKEAEFWKEGLTPRQLQKIAEARIGVEHEVWLADCHRLFMSPERLRTLRDLPLFIERPAKKVNEPARPTTEKAEAPEPGLPPKAATRGSAAMPAESRSELTVAPAGPPFKPSVLDIGKPEKPQYGDVWLRSDHTGSNFVLVAHAGVCVLNGGKKFETRDAAESRLREIRNLTIEQRTNIYILSADTVEEGLAKIKEKSEPPSEEDKSDYMVSPTGRVHYEGGRWVVQQLCEIGGPEHPQGRWAKDATAPFETREAAIAAAPEILARMEKADTDEIRDAEKRKKRELVRVDSLEPMRYMTAARENATHWRRWEEYQDNTGDWRTVPGSVRVDPLKPRPQPETPTQAMETETPGDRVWVVICDNEADYLVFATEEAAKVCVADYQGKIPADLMPAAIRPEPASNFDLTGCQLALGEYSQANDEPPKRIVPLKPQTPENTEVPEQ